MFVGNVYALCKERGMSIMALEKASGIGNGTIGKWAIKGASPNLTTAKKVADVLGVTVDALLNGNGNSGKGGAT